MYVVTPDCPVAYLASSLSQPTFDALAMALGPFATVGDVAELCEHRRLMELYGIGPSRAGEIRRCLVEAGFVEPGTQLIWRDLHRRRAARGHAISYSSCS